MKDLQGQSLFFPEPWEKQKNKKKSISDHKVYDENI